MATSEKCNLLKNIESNTQFKCNITDIILPCFHFSLMTPHLVHVLYPEKNELPEACKKWLKSSYYGNKMYVPYSVLEINIYIFSKATIRVYLNIYVKR